MKTDFFTIHIVEILTNKGANSYKLNISKIGNTKLYTVYFKVKDGREAYEK